MHGSTELCCRETHCFCIFELKIIRFECEMLVSLSDPEVGVIARIQHSLLTNGKGSDAFECCDMIVMESLFSSGS